MRRCWRIAYARFLGGIRVRRYRASAAATPPLTPATAGGGQRGPDGGPRTEKVIHTTLCTVRNEKNRGHLGVAPGLRRCANRYRSAPRCGYEPYCVGVASRLAWR